MRLFCFPYAGGGASAYRGWHDLLPPGVELVAIQPPGRETRFNEPPLRDMSAMLAEVARAMAPMLDRPYAVFGHSLGSLVAFELVRLLRQSGLPLPEHLFVSGRRAPHVPIDRRAFHDLADADLIDELRKMRGMTDQLLENEELMAVLLPTLRADFAVHDTYRYREQPALALPVTVFGGLEDEVTTPENLAAWSSMTAAASQVRLFPGGHFFINEHRDDVLAVISRELHPLLEPAAARLRA